MDKKSHILLGHASYSWGKYSVCAFSQDYQDSVKHHVAKPVLDTYLPAEPASKPSLDPETASASHLQSDVGLTWKAKLPLDDTQKGKARAALADYYNYATLADWLFFHVAT